MAGVLLMAAFVFILFAIVLRYAGGWGVPYFSFTTDHGSPCKNGLTGYTCSPLTVEDVEYYGQLDLPAGTTISSGTYVSTHDYRLDARVLVPAAGAAAARQMLADNFGTCQPSHPSPLPGTGLTRLCVLANDTDVAQSGEPSSRLFLVGTGLRKDGSRDIVLSIKSR